MALHMLILEDRETPHPNQKTAAQRTLATDLDRIPADPRDADLDGSRWRRTPEADQHRG